jgi:hypothetical protein
MCLNGKGSENEKIKLFQDFERTFQYLCYVENKLTINEKGSGD